MDNKKKSIISVIIVLLIIVVVSSATYAVYKWRSTTGLNVNISVTDNITVTFNGGTNITGRIKPVDSASKGIVKDIVVKSNLPTNDTFNLYLKINQLPEALKDSTFKWTLSECNNLSNCTVTNEMVHVVGNFTTTSMNDYIVSGINNTLLLLENQSIPFSRYLHLYLYIWMDGTVDNDPSMGGNHIDFDIYATGTGATLVEIASQQEGD